MKLCKQFCSRVEWRREQRKNSSRKKSRKDDCFAIAIFLFLKVENLGLAQSLDFESIMKSSKKKTKMPRKTGKNCHFASQTYLPAYLFLNTQVWFINNNSKKWNKIQWVQDKVNLKIFHYIVNSSLYPWTLFGKGSLLKIVYLSKQVCKK